MQNISTKSRSGSGARTGAPVRPESWRGFQVGDRVNVNGFEEGILKYIGAVHFKVSSLLLKYDRLVIVKKYQLVFYRRANRLSSLQ